MKQIKILLFLFLLTCLVVNINAQTGGIKTINRYPNIMDITEGCRQIKNTINNKWYYLDNAGTTWASQDSVAVVNLYVAGIATNQFIATQEQTVYTLTSTPKGALIMCINGIPIPTAAYSFVGVTVTYVNSGNDNYPINAGDRINFIY